MSRGSALYVDNQSMMHSLDGGVKFFLLLVWTICVFLFNDIRIFTLFFVSGMGLLFFSKISFKTIKPLFIFILTFTIVNSIFLIVITPEYGSELTGHFTPLLTFRGKGLPLETVWFALTLSMKYMAIFPLMLLFVLTTHPSKFASSLNKIGVPYKVAYAINIALRYIPDVNKEFKNIMYAQEARGVAFKKGEASIFTRMRNYNTILVPLIISSLNRIEVISNAMNLRGFGNLPKRTWYNGQKYSKDDVLVFIFIILLFLLSLYLKMNIFKRFWYPGYLI